MEKTIKRLLRCLRIEYIALWAVVILVSVLYELEVLPQGMLVSDVKNAYMMEVVGILLSIVLIPVSLRLFNMSLFNNVKQKQFQDAMVSYRRWNEIRLALLLVPAVFNLSVYYWTLETECLLCAGMALIASFFCVPSRSRIVSELDLVSDDADIACKDGNSTVAGGSDTNTKEEV